MINDYQLDALKEVINIGVGKSSAVLSEMISHKVDLSVPIVRIIEKEKVKTALDELNIDLVSMVNMNFEGEFNGSIMLAFPPDSADNMVTTLSDESFDTSEIQSIRSGAIIEVGNIVLNGILGSLGNILSERLHYSVPVYYEDSLKRLASQKMSTMNSDQLLLLLFETRFNISDLQISGDILLFLELGSFKTLISKLNTLIDKD